jgi:hypothetical protein
MGRLGVASAGAGLRRSFLGLVKGRPTFRRGFPNGLQTRRRPLPLLGLGRWGWLRLLLLLRRPPRPLRSRDPGAARFADRAALLRSSVSKLAGVIAGSQTVVQYPGRRFDTLSISVGMRRLMGMASIGFHKPPDIVWRRVAWT